MPASVAPLFQSLFVLLLPALATVAPWEGALRTVALRPVPMAAIVNAVVAVDGRIVAGGSGEGMVVTGRRDRIVLALLSLGVVALPTAIAGCSNGVEG